jgi:copper chaperone CopZ
MRVSPWWIPAAVLVLALLGIGSANLVAVPSYTRDFQSAAAADAAGFRTAVLLVEGLRCVDTAERAAAQLEGAPGVIRFVAFASRNRAELTYDPARTGPAAIVGAIEGPVYNEATGEVAFQVYRVLEVDGIRRDQVPDTGKRSR